MTMQEDTGYAPFSITSRQLLDLLDRFHRRATLSGTEDCGVIAALDLEGRLFTVLNGRVVHRVVPDAIIGRSTRNGYLNPGGDALWPAPEGSCFGYEYATENWRVPPSITGAVWLVTDTTSGNNSTTMTMEAEIDLIDNRGTGFPCLFQREISLVPDSRGLLQITMETIRYIGRKNHTENFLLAPWSLSQFDVVPGGQVVLEPDCVPHDSENDLWDLYEPSHEQRHQTGRGWQVNPETSRRFQLACSSGIKALEYKMPCGLLVRREVLKVGPGALIDISDSAPDTLPARPATKLSVYCDPSGFLELEACGPSPAALVPGAEAVVTIATRFEFQ